MCVFVRGYVRLHAITQQVLVCVGRQLHHSKPLLIKPVKVCLAKETLRAHNSFLCTALAVGDFTGVFYREQSWKGRMEWERWGSLLSTPNLVIAPCQMPAGCHWPASPSAGQTRTTLESHPSQQRLFRLTWSLSYPASPWKQKWGEKREGREDSTRYNVFFEPTVDSWVQINPKQTSHNVVVFFFCRRREGKAAPDKLLAVLTRGFLKLLLCTIYPT